MIGSLLGVIAIRCCGWLTQEMPHARKGGQWVIATGIGLHFNQAIVEQIATHALVIVLGTVLTVTASVIGIVLLRRSGEDRATAFFASMPGGANEMVNLAKRNDAILARVAAAQSLRMVFVLLSVPAAYKYLFAGESPVALHAVEVNYSWLLPIMLVGAGLAFIFQKLRLPNAWQLGALLVSIAASVTFDLNIGLPAGAGDVGQWLIGSSLGCYFDRPFFRQAPAFMARTVLATLMAILIAAPIAAGLGWLTELDARSLLLRMVPGGIAEMSLTAEALHLMVPLVTAMQVLRLLLVLFLAQPVYRLWLRRVAN
jgi:membrane AbrB-like protein